LKPKLVDGEKGSIIISEKDSYIRHFSNFDLQSRLGTMEEVSKKELLQFLCQQTLDWTSDEREMIEKIFQEIESAYHQYKKYLPDKILIIKTTGHDECDAAYTRKNCIYIPISMIRCSYNELKELIAHELFHIVSTQNPEFRNSLYAKLGFTPCPELEVPEDYKELYVTNPDTIEKNCYVEFQENGKPVKAIPFLYSEEPYQGGYFFRYFRFTFLSTQIKNGKCFPVYDKNQLKFIDAPQELYDLCIEIDPYNNQHRLHPEEILAYYWSLLAFPESELEYAKHKYLLKIRECLHNNKNPLFH